MPPFLADILSQLKAIWARLDGGQRMTIGAVMLATIVGIGAIVWYAGQPSYVTILAGENTAQVNKAMKALSGQGIEFQRRGREILVDRNKSQAAQDALMMGNIIGDASKGGGFMEGLMTSSDDRRAADMIRRQRQAAEMIMGMTGVQHARVTASRPKTSPFKSMDRVNQPRATAVVHIAAGASFRTVSRGAVEIVSSTIPVPPEYVVIINGVTQEKFTSDPNNPSLDTDGFRAQERELESVYEAKALRLLGPLQDKVRLTVTINLDEKFSSTERDYFPPEPIVAQESTTKEDRKDAPSRVAGDPNVNTATSGGSKKSTTDRTYMQNLGTVREGLQAPRMKSIAFALTVDTTIKNDNKVGAIIETVKKALAFGDEARTESAPTQADVLVTDFPKVEPPAPVEGPGMTSTVMQYLPVIGQVLGVLLVILFLRSILKRSAPSRRAASASGAGKEESIEEQLDDLDNLEALGTDESVRRMRREIEQAINDDPAVISNMLDTWLQEQKA